MGLALLLIAALNTWPGAIAAPPAQATPEASPVPTASPQPSAPILYTLDLRDAYTRHESGIRPFNVGDPNKGKSYEQMLQDYDLLIFVATLQGIVNRDQPRLYVYHAAGLDDYWLQTFRRSGEWLYGYQVVPLAGLDDLLATFGAAVTGTVVWDDRVPATLNVATTIAGVENTPVVRRGSALYDRITSVLPVRTDLSGRFMNKAEAYRWAAQTYLQSGRANPRLLAYIEDGWPAVLYQRQTLPGGGTSTLTRDYIVQHRGFAFDLSVWADEAPVDEPGQPLGQDRAVFEEVLLAARARAGQDMIALWGIMPWWQKYSNSPGAGGRHEPTEGEWETVWLASSYGAYSTGTLGDVYGLDMANASVHRFAPFPSHVPRLPAPNPDELRRQGYLEGSLVAPKTYVLYYMGDFDFAQPLYALMPDLWQDERRGDLPLAWGINPEVVDIFPDILDYLARTRTAADFFVAADSGAGYLNPEALPAGLRPAWEKHNLTYYRRLGLTITGFFLNGKGGEAPDEVLQLYKSFSPDGITINENHLVGIWPRLRANVPLTAFPHFGLSNAAPLAEWTAEVDKAYDEYQAAHGAGRPVFITLRCVYTTPTFLYTLTEELRRQHPERDYQVVDPYTYFFLLRKELGGSNERRATFLRPLLPAEMTAGTTQALQAPVRNDGWDTWPAGTVGLGLDVAPAAAAGAAPGSAGEAVFLPLEKPVAPGEVYTFTFLLGAPLRAGDYVVQYNLLELPWTWFHAAGNPWMVENISVQEPSGGMQQEPPPLPDWPTPAPVGPNAPQSLPSAQPTPEATTTTPVAPPPATTVPVSVDLPAGWSRPPLIERGLAGRVVWAIARDAAGRIWFGGEQGVASFHPHDDLLVDDDEWRTYTVADGLPHQWVTAIAADAHGGVWFGTQGGGVVYYDQNGWTPYGEEDGLASNWVRAIAVDAQGLVWFGTSKGISVFSGTTWQTFTRNDSPLPRDVVTAIAFDKDGNRWFATEGGGVTRLSADGRDWRTYTTADGLGDNFVLALAVDAGGYIWAGTWRGGLSVFDGGTWLTYKTENSGLSANWVQGLAVDAQGRIWCGTYGLPGAGISVLTPGTGQWATYGPADGLPSDNVTVLAATRPGEMWVGTEMGAVRYLEPLLLLGPQTPPTPGPSSTGPAESVTPEPTWPGDWEQMVSRGGGEQGPALVAWNLPPLQATPTRLPSPTRGTVPPTVTRLPSPTPPVTSEPTIPPTVPTDTPEPTALPSPTPTSLPSPTATASPSVSPSPSPTTTRTTTPTPSPTGTMLTATPTPTPSPSVTGTPPTATPTWTPYPTSTPYVTPTPTSAGGCCPPCPVLPPAPPPPLPTREEDLDLVHTFTASSGTVKRINERPGGNALRVPETRGIGGQAIRVYVNADTLVWVAGIQLELAYDTTMLTAVGVNLTPRSAAMTRPEPMLDPASGKVNLLLFSPEGQAIPPGRGPILSLLFEVGSGATNGQKAQIRIVKAILTDVDGNKVNVPAGFIYNGYLVICTTCFLHNGDIDKDGAVTVIDVQRGINIVLGRHIADDEEVVALDINGDGAADVLDVIKVVNLALGRVTPTPWAPTPTPIPTVTPTPSPTASPTEGTPPPTASPTEGTPPPTASPTAGPPPPTDSPTAGPPPPTDSPTPTWTPATPSPTFTEPPSPTPLTPYPTP